VKIHDLVRAGALSMAEAYLHIYLETPHFGNLKSLARALCCQHKEISKMFKKLEKEGLASKEQKGSRLYEYQAISVSLAFGEKVDNPPGPREFLPDFEPPQIEEPPAPKSLSRVEELLVEQAQKDEAAGKY